MAKLIDITGKAVSGEWGTDDETGDGIPVLRTTNFTNEGVVDYNNVVTRTITKKNIDEKFLRRGDIIIEKSGGSDKFPVGRVIYFDGDENTYLFNNFTGLLRVKDKKAWYPRYVFYSLFANYRSGGTRAFENKTTGLHNLKTDDYVSRYEVAEVAVSEQMTICNKLDKLYGIIKSREQELQLLDELIQSRFIEMFGNDDEFLQKAQNQVSDICNSRVGIVIQPTQYYTDDPNGVKAFRSLNIKPFYVNDYDWVFFSESDNAMLNRTQVRTDDVAVVRSGVNLGDSCVIPEIYNGCNAIDILLLTCTADILPIYLSAFINYPVGKQQILNIQRGGAIKHLNLKQLESSRIYVPDLTLQKQFASFVAQTDKSKTAVQKALEESQLLFDSLMQKYFG